MLKRFAKNRFGVMSREQLKKQPWVPKMFLPLLRNMLDQDPPDHTRLRALVQQAFSPRFVDRMQGRIAELADDDRFRLRDGEVPETKSVRFRTLGCYPLSGAIQSDATTLLDVVQEMLMATTSVSIRRP